MANNDEKKKKAAPKKNTQKTTSVKKAPAKTTKKSSSTKVATTKKVTAKAPAKKVTSKVATKAPATKKGAVKAVPKKTSTKVAPKKVTTNNKVEKSVQRKKVTPNTNSIKPKVVPTVQNVPKEEKPIVENIETNNITIRVLITLICIVLVAGVIYISKNMNKTKKEEESTYREFDTSKYKDKQQLKEDEDIPGGTSNNKVDVSEIGDYSNLNTISINELSEKMDTKEKMIVFVASTTCGVCTIYEPILNGVLSEMDKKAYKINVADFETEDEKDLFKGIFDITGTPALAIINNGSIKASFQGAKDREDTKNWIEDNY